MFSFISGKLLTHTSQGAIVRVGDVGYELIGSWLFTVNSGDQLEAWLYQYHENDSIPRLIACRTSQGRDLLIELISVSGVGPKMAGKIVDSIPLDRLTEAIRNGDLEVLGSVKGLGKKTAQKIVLELGKKLVSDSTTTAKYSSVFQALISLKFKPSEIEQAIKSVDLNGLTDDQQIAVVLKALGKSK